MNRCTATIVCVLIGRDYCSDQLFDYFEHAVVPQDITHITLRLVAAYDPGFREHVDQQISKHGLHDKFDQIIHVPGGPRVGEEFKTWSEWEANARCNFVSKHQSTCDNLNHGIQSTTEDFIHIIDDDTIPPHEALQQLYQELITDEQIGMTTGMYFSKVWDHNPKWRSREQRTREVCASVKHHNWVPSTIDEFAAGNVRNIKWCGNGCMLTRGEFFRELPELQVSGVNDNHARGPDWHMCDNINTAGKIIRMVPSIFCEHRYDSNMELVAGLGTRYIEALCDSQQLREEVLITSDYPMALERWSDFDQVHVVVNRDIPGPPPKGSNIHMHQFNIQGDMRSVRMEHERYIYKIMNTHPRIHSTTDLDFTVGFAYKDIICSTYMEDYFCR